MEKCNYYDTIADIYDRTRWLTESVAEEVADFIVELVNASPETSFLEPGVGTGLNVLPLVRRGYAVTGIDRTYATTLYLGQGECHSPLQNTICGGSA
jgi:SAM-dependent methyltransferase